MNPTGPLDSGATGALDCFSAQTPAPSVLRASARGGSPSRRRSWLSASRSCCRLSIRFQEAKLVGLSHTIVIGAIPAELQGLLPPAGTTSAGLPVITVSRTFLDHVAVRDNSAPCCAAGYGCHHELATRHLVLASSSKVSGSGGFAADGVGAASVCAGSIAANPNASSKRASGTRSVYGYWTTSGSSIRPRESTRSRHNLESRRVWIADGSSDSAIFAPPGNEDTQFRQLTVTTQRVQLLTPMPAMVVAFDDRTIRSGQAAGIQPAERGALGDVLSAPGDRAQRRFEAGTR